MRIPPLLLLSVFMLFTATASAHVFADTMVSVTITIQGLPANLSTNVYINGNFNQTLAGGSSTTYTLAAANAPYIISVDSYVPGSINGTRYYCENMTWQTSSSGSKAFTYVTQYFLAVDTAYSKSTGQGWYTSGTTAYATLASQQAAEGQGTQYIFNGWSGDATGTQLTSNGIIMNAPKVAVADWKTQFFLTVESDPENTTGLSGSGWYDAGTQANFSALMTIPVTSNTRLVFSHWSGEFSGDLPSGSVSMDRPKMVKAVYTPQYLLSISYAPAEITNAYNDTAPGWYDTNSDVQLGPVPTIINISPVERLQFAGWADNGSTSPNLSYTVVMNAPRNVTLSYTTQYYLDVQSAYGNVTGSGWYDRGTTATITAPTSVGSWPIMYTFTGWNVDPANQAPINNGDSWTITVDGPYTIQANWSMNYLPLILLFAVTGTLTTVGVGVAVGYKRGGLIRKREKPRPAKAAAIPTVQNMPETNQVCSKCGNAIASGAGFCEECGTAVAAPQNSLRDDLVYNYIVDRGGIISLSAASNDLGLDVELLKEIIERLKREGRLS